jgi:short-subunit dehydrogenase
VLSFGQAIAHELSGGGISVTTLCPGPTETEFAQVAHMEGVALFKGPMPIMSAADVAHRGYQALLRGQRVVITGLVNSVLALSTRFTPTSVLLFIAGRMNASL